MTVGYAVTDQVARITFTRPEKLNALTPETYGELGAHIERAVLDPEVAVIVLAGEGRAFVAGADIEMYVGLSQQKFLKFIDEGHRVLGLLASSPKPVIAMVKGFALGGGFEIVLACDLVIAADNARFGLPEARLGLLPGGGGTQRLARLVGRTRANDLIMTGRMINADEAAAWGIVSRVTGKEGLEEGLAALVAEVLQSAPGSLAIAKRLIAESHDSELGDGLVSERKLTSPLIESADGQEGITAFIEKRTPRFGSHNSA